MMQPFFTPRPPVDGRGAGGEGGSKDKLHAPRNPTHAKNTDTLRDGSPTLTPNPSPAHGRARGVVFKHLSANA
jgi:hypothetical protein